MSYSISYSLKNCNILFLNSSHAVTSDVSLSETVKAAEFFLADGIILTGTATGDPVKTTELTGILFMLINNILNYKR